MAKNLLTERLKRAINVQARLRATNLENDTEQGKQERKQSMN